jgi:hypothetical protein
MVAVASGGFAAAGPVIDAPVEQLRNTFELEPAPLLSVNFTTLAA